MNLTEGKFPRLRDPLSIVQSYQQGADQTGSRRGGNQINVAQVNCCVAQRGLTEFVDQFKVRAPGELGDHSAELAMHGLRVSFYREYFPIADHSGRAFVAARFKGKHLHAQAPVNSEI
jgi:hypothetical protein